MRIVQSAVLLLGTIVLASLAGCAMAAGAARASQANAQLEQRFAAADTNHDGLLTLQEAQQGMPRVASNFDAIDTAHTGAVTLAQVQAYARSHMGRRRGSSAAAAPP